MTPPQYELPVPDRPVGVTVAAVILLVTAGLGLLACGAINVLAGEARLPEQDRTLLLGFSAVLAGASVLSGALGYFILRGRQWARVTAIVLAVLWILGSLVSFFTSYHPQAEGSALASTCTGVVPNLVVIFLLSGSRASDYFRYAHR